MDVTTAWMYFLLTSRTNDRLSPTVVTNFILARQGNFQLFFPQPLIFGSFHQGKEQRNIFKQVKFSLTNKK